MSAHRVAILGGTFDPIHRGHLAIAAQARDIAGLEETWLIPSSIPPHRTAASASNEDRLAMVRAAAATDPRLRVLDIEMQRGGPSYTADTLRQLEAEHLGVEFWIVLGADAARDIVTWRGRAELLDRARFLIVNRSGVAPLDDAEARQLGFAVPDRCLIIHVDSPPISATAVRDRVAEGGTLDDLVPPSVADIITARRLYPRGTRPDQVG